MVLLRAPIPGHDGPSQDTLDGAPEELASWVPYLSSLVCGKRTHMYPKVPDAVDPLYCHPLDEGVALCSL